MTRGAVISLLFGGACLAAAALGATPALPQALDCNRLAAQIAAASQGGSGGRYAAAAQKQRGELARMSAYAQNLGCDRPQFLFFGNRPPQCDGVNAQIARMQANLQSLSQAGGENGRAILQARFDAYCRNTENYGTARGFFERLFDTNRQERLEPPPGDDGAPRIMEEPDDSPREARGGSQAVCVRTCDGGFFPVSYAARSRDLGELQDLCSALCPGTEAKLYTRVPGREISTAISPDGSAYGDLPNALKFEKVFDKTCSCKPADKTWVEALANAEKILAEQRNGGNDILVTPERADELSKIAGPAGGREPRPRKFDPRAAARAAGLPAPPASLIEQEKKSADEATASDAAAAASAPTAGTASSGIAAGDAAGARVLGPDEGARTDAAAPNGARRKVRMIAPQL